MGRRRQRHSPLPPCHRVADLGGPLVGPSPRAQQDTPASLLLLGQEPPWSWCQDGSQFRVKLSEGDLTKIPRVSAHQNMAQALEKGDPRLSGQEEPGFHLQLMEYSPFFSVFSQTTTTATHSPCTLEASQEDAGSGAPAPWTCDGRVHPSSRTQAPPPSARASFHSPEFSGWALLQPIQHPHLLGPHPRLGRGAISSPCLGESTAPGRPCPCSHLTLPPGVTRTGSGSRQSVSLSVRACVCKRESMRWGGRGMGLPDAS